MRVDEDEEEEEMWECGKSLVSSFCFSDQLRGKKKQEREGGQCSYRCAKWWGCVPSVSLNRGPYKLCGFI